MDNASTAGAIPEVMDRSRQFFVEKIHYTRKEYREQYLRSEEWRLLSAAILLRDPVCRLCEKRESSDAHHLTYERIHHERSDDLIGICRPCHNFVHKYRELSKIKNLKALKGAVKFARRKHFFTQEIYNQAAACNHRAFLLIAGALKVPAHHLNGIVGSRINYAKYCRIKDLIRLNPKADDPSPTKYGRSRKHFSRL